MHISRQLLRAQLALVGASTLADASVFQPRDSNTACDSLSSAFPNQVLFPDSSPYDAAVSSYNYIPVRLHPTCFFKPKDTAQVSQAVEILGTDHPDTHYAIRGGGHNTNPGFANIEDGVTIDLTEMNAVEVVEADEVVKVGAGAIWQQVYDELEPKGLSVSGGRIGIVGMGLTIGCGISFFSPAKGWVCDSATNFEIVLSNGTAINANIDSSPDLFAALKGGLNNFGIVTSITFKIFDQGPMWGGTILYESSNQTHSDLLSAITDYKNPENFHADASMWLGLIYNSTSKAYTTHASFFYAKPENDTPAVFKPFVDIKPQIFSQIVTQPAGSFAKEFSAGSRVDPVSVLWSTTTFKWDPTILHELYDLWESYLNTKLPEFTTSSLSLQAIPPPPREGQPPNSLGFPTDSHPEKDLILLQVIMEYLDPAVADQILELVKDFETEIDNLVKSKDLYHPFKYLNYAGWWQDVFGGYGEEQVAKLKSVAEKYDPVAMFQKQVVGGFKLPQY